MGWQQAAGATERGSGSSAHRREGAGLLACLALVLASSLLCQLTRLPHLFEWGDEGFFANGALRILSGEVVYRDFQHNYAPGRLFSLALLIRLFGHDLLVVRLFWVALHAAAACLALLLARRLMPLGFALAAALCVVFNMVHMNKSAELAAAALVMLTLARNLEGRGSDFATGVLLAVAGLFRQDLGVAAAGLYAVSLSLQAWQPNAREGGSYGSRLAARLRRAWPFLLGGALVALPVLAYLAVHGALEAALRDTLFAGLRANLAMAIPFPRLVEDWSPPGLWEALISRRLLFYATPILYAASALVAIRMLRGPERERGSLALLVSLLGAALFLQVLPRSDWGHLQKAYLPAHLLGFFLAAVCARSMASLLRSPRPRRALAFAPVLGLVFLLPLAQLAQNLGTRTSVWWVLREGSGTRSVRFPHGDLRLPAGDARELRRLVRVVREEREKLDPSQPQWMLSFPAGALFNFLFGIPTPLRYDALRPGELDGNDSRIVTEILETQERTRPLFLLHDTENSNPELSQRIDRAAGDDYERVPTALLVLYVRRS